MAKIKQGILGGFSGSVANIVGSSWKGMAVMKSKPLSVANPRTAKQVAQRNAFKAASQTAAGCKANIIKPFWDKSAQYMSGANAWMSDNVKNYNSSGIPTLNDLVFSKGSIGSQNIDNATVNAGGTLVTITWDKTDIPQNGSLSDLAAAVVIGDKGEVLGSQAINTVTREDEVLDMTVNFSSNPTHATAYLLFKDAEEIKQSESNYYQIM